MSAASSAPVTHHAAVPVAPEPRVQEDAPPSRCYHCGETSPAPGRWRTVLAGAERSFCCAGCLGIARTIHGAGLEAFYAQRTQPAARADAATASADEWIAWDDPAVHGALVRAYGDERAEVSLLLEGIRCSACTWLIETWLARESGVLLASVNYATRRARVVWDPRQRRLSDLLRAVSGIGYRAHPYDPARREALAQRESRNLLVRTAVALLAMMQVMMFAVPAYVSVDGIEPVHQRLLSWASLTLTLPALLYCAAPFFQGAWRDLALRRAGMDVPIALGLVAAFAGSVVATAAGHGPEYYDSITMFIALLLVARYVELRARQRAGDAVEAAARSHPATAERLHDWPRSQATEMLPAATLSPDDVVLVRPGSILPADGVVLEGEANVEEAVLTGEARPCAKRPGDAVLAGSVARDAALVMRVVAAGRNTRLAAIERLVERAAGERPHAAKLADRVAAHFVTALLLVALGTALAWTLLDPARALPVTFAVLAVSCPCALSLATPAALAAAAGALSRRQVVIARADALETLARVTHVVFDKTGTLTSGRLTLSGVRVAKGLDRSAVLAMAAALEARSEHPLARAIRAAAANLAVPLIEDLRIMPGEGVEGIVAGRHLRLGRPAFVAGLGAAVPDAWMQDSDASATVVALGAAGEGLLALFTLHDELRPRAAALVRRLHQSGIGTVLLSGDREAAVRDVGRALGIREARGDVLPEGKRAAVAGLQQQGAVVAMFGDGINDAPSLAQAQVSLSLGSATPLAQWTADVVVLTDDLERVAEAIGTARRAMRIVRQNLVWAFAYNVVAIPAAAFGLVTPLVAAVGMSASSVIVVANALRAARGPRRARPPADDATRGVLAA